MILTLIRDIFTDKATTGALSIDGKPGFYVCEDTDRGLDALMPLAEIQRRKVKGQTAIPTGRYRVAWRWSEKHKAEVPWLDGVPGFQAIEIHSGNTPDQTEGCQLVGTVRGLDSVGHSRAAIEWLYPRIKAAVASPEGCWYEIHRDPSAWEPFRAARGL